MSKEKSIVHINNVSKIIGSKRIKMSEGMAIHIQNELVLALKELEDQNMTKFKVVRYWDTYPDGVVATCDTQEEAEKICKEYLKKRKPMYDYLVRKENE